MPDNRDYVDLGYGLRALIVEHTSQPSMVVQIHTRTQDDKIASLYPMPENRDAAFFPRLHLVTTPGVTIAQTSVYVLNHA